MPLVRMQVVTVQHQKGVGKASNKPYDFLSVGALMDTPKGRVYVELMLDGDDALPEVSKVYDAEIEFYADRNKRLAMAVRGLRTPVPAKAA